MLVRFKVFCFRKSEIVTSDKKLKDLIGRLVIQTLRHNLWHFLYTSQNLEPNKAFNWNVLSYCEEICLFIYNISNKNYVMQLHLVQQVDFWILAKELESCDSNSLYELQDFIYMYIYRESPVRCVHIRSRLLTMKFCR